MIKSMTGYGKAESATQNKKISVEIRSLNSKQLDLSIKLPAIYRPFEYEIRVCHKSSFLNCAIVPKRGRFKIQCRLR